MCHVYAHLVLGCVFVFFWVCRAIICLGVHFFVLCWSVLLYGVLGLLCVSFSLCVHVLVPGDVISSRCVVLRTDPHRNLIQNRDVAGASGGDVNIP